ncbi:hypothetical protein [Thalassobaculum litoreum]|uniref:Uncharacterized protein n=1 Tax=Thalassobaculum litoreum DSM 18839 TaxID=1123362 RepID=A0A8G2BIP1_9PROT|nr:hypothetical protein [Thalassobaculum litoreum]SDF84263.1 hypothetical protein SAMN05660686_02503 [Thalassobaculum litoreum DSM 18839]
MTDEELEQLGLAFDRLENVTTMLINGASVGDDIHVLALRSALPEIVEQMRPIVESVSAD